MGVGILIEGVVEVGGGYKQYGALFSVNGIGASAFDEYIDGSRSKCLIIFNLFGFLLIIFLLCLGAFNSLIDLSASAKLT